MKHEDMLQARVEELETRLAFQEDTLQTLSDQLAHQQDVIEQQQQQLQLLYSQLRDMRDTRSPEGDSEPAMEKPPHY